MLSFLLLLLLFCGYLRSFLAAHFDLIRHESNPLVCRWLNSHILSEKSIRCIVAHFLPISFYLRSFKIRPNRRVEKMMFAPWISYANDILCSCTFITTDAMMGSCLMDLRNSAVRCTNQCMHLIIFSAVPIIHATEMVDIPRQLCKFLTIDCRKKNNSTEMRKKWNEMHTMTMTMTMTMVKYLWWWSDELLSWHCGTLNSSISQNFKTDGYLMVATKTHTQTHTRKSILRAFHSFLPELWSKKGTSEFFITNEKEAKKELRCHEQTRKYLKYLTKNEILRKRRPKKKNAFEQIV